MAAYLVQNKDGSMCLAVEAESQEHALKQAFPDGDGSLPKGVSVTDVSVGSAAPAPAVVPAPPPTKDELPHAHDSEPEEPKA